MINRIKCWLFGHKRGKRTNREMAPELGPIVEMRCPRCGHRWLRKVK